MLFYPTLAECRSSRRWRGSSRRQRQRTGRPSLRGPVQRPSPLPGGLAARHVLPCGGIAAGRMVVVERHAPTLMLHCRRPSCHTSLPPQRRGADACTASNPRGGAGQGAHGGGVLDILLQSFYACCCWLSTLAAWLKLLASVRWLHPSSNRHTSTACAHPLASRACQRCTAGAAAGH